MYFGPICVELVQLDGGNSYLEMSDFFEGTVQWKEVGIESASLFPATDSAVVRSAEGVETTIISTSYDDYHFVNITQINKMGTVIHAWPNKIEGMGDVIYETKTLLGKREDSLLDVYARQIIERIEKVSNKPLILAISLKEEGRDAKTFSDILNKLYAISGWA